MDNFLQCGISCYSSYLKICLEYKTKRLCFSRKLINFDDVMIDEIKKLTLRMDKNFKDIKTLCILRGPGRFTAIRSVFTFASVYSVISRCQVYGIDLFGCLAYNVFEFDNSDKDIAIISHAFRNEYYLAFYRIRDKKLFEFKKAKWLFLDEVIENLKFFEGFIVFDSDEFDFDFSLIKNKKIKIPPSDIMRVIPENIIKSCLYFKDKNYSPIYLKPAKFELK